MWEPRVIVAPDSFKGSLGAAEAAAAIAAGVRRAIPAATVIELPLSDGGEGWLATLLAADPEGRLVTVPVTGPLGEPREGRFGLIEDGRTAVIEVATASGLHLVDPSPATFRRASSRGAGELTEAALDAGACRLLIGLGGSATTDGGAGLAAALGARFLGEAPRADVARAEAPRADVAARGDDVDGPKTGHMGGSSAHRRGRGEAIGPGNAALASVLAVDLAGLDPRLAATEVLVATDVDNPLLGPTGAAAVYGPQKGARPEDVAAADAALANFADRVEAALGRELRGLPGAGAAGGLGFGLLAFCGARLVSGIELALDAVGFDAALADADLVITGEGRIDRQTLHGKAVAGVAARARAADVPTFAIGGIVDPDVFAGWPDFQAAGLVAVEATLDGPPDPAALAPGPARERLARAAERLLEPIASGVGGG